jgi:hypothetical protein
MAGYSNKCDSFQSFRLLLFLRSETIHAADDIGRIISIAFAVSSFDVDFVGLDLAAAPVRATEQKILAND